jgi:RHS repeat-associated protein
VAIALAHSRGSANRRQVCRKHAYAPFRRAAIAATPSGAPAPCSATAEYDSIRPLARFGTVQRYYDPGTGQFMSLDPLNGMTDAGYEFVKDNPFGGSDPTGTIECGAGPYCSPGATGNAPAAAEPISPNVYAPSGPAASSLSTAYSWFVSTNHISGPIGSAQEFAIWTEICSSGGNCGSSLANTVQDGLGAGVGPLSGFVFIAAGSAVYRSFTDPESYPVRSLSPLREESLQTRA